MQHVACDASVAFQVSFVRSFRVVLKWLCCALSRRQRTWNCWCPRDSVIIFMTDESSDLGFKIIRQKVIFQQDAILQCLIPTLNFALRFRMIWPAARVLHAPVFLCWRNNLFSLLLFNGEVKQFSFEKLSRWFYAVQYETHHRHTKSICT